LKRLIVDLDGTLCELNPEVDYAHKKPKINIIKRLQEYKNTGFIIVIFTSRNMNTFKDNLGLINANTLPVIIEWLKKYNVPYDEILIGKPWCGEQGFYIDDKAIRPSEFVNHTYDEIIKILNNEKLPDD
jgi:capsule biosynthesis phosphatase